MALTERQQRFVTEYVARGNATRAAIAAGYSERSAEMTGSRMMRNAKVRDAIAAARKAQQKRVEISADMILEGLLDEARFSGEGASHSARVNAWTRLAELTKVFDRTQDAGELPTLRIDMPPGVDNE